MLYAQGMYADVAMVLSSFSSELVQLKVGWVVSFGTAAIRWRGHRVTLLLISALSSCSAVLVSTALSARSDAIVSRCFACQRVFVSSFYLGCPY